MGSDETETTAWKPEDDIEAENINTEIPRDLWDTLLWQALRIAIDAGETKEQVLRMIKAWNSRNTPRIPDKDLIQKVIWALGKWDTKFRKT